MERQDRERRKEEQRLLREQQKQEEKFQREEKREMERREKFMQRELMRVYLQLMSISYFLSNLLFFLIVVVSIKLHFFPIGIPGGEKATERRASQREGSSKTESCSGESDS